MGHAHPSGSCGHDDRRNYEYTVGMEDTVDEGEKQKQEKARRKRSKKKLSCSLSLCVGGGVASVCLFVCLSLVVLQQKPDDVPPRGKRSLTRYNWRGGSDRLDTFGSRQPVRQMCCQVKM